MYFNIKLFPLGEKKIHYLKRIKSNLSPDIANEGSCIVVRSKPHDPLCSRDLRLLSSTELMLFIFEIVLVES